MLSSTGMKSKKCSPLCFFVPSLPAHTHQILPADIADKAPILARDNRQMRDILL